MNAKGQWIKDYELARILVNGGSPDTPTHFRLKQLKNHRAVDIAIKYVPPPEPAWQRLQNRDAPF